MIHKRLKAIVLWLVGVAVTIGLISLIWFVPQYQTQKARERVTAAINNLNPNDQPKERLQLEKDLTAAENSARTTIAQILGGLVLLSGLYFTYRNLRVTEEGKLTDRFSKAIELLGNDKLDIRLGGIYALERLARDSKNDHWTIMEVLTAYIREHSKREETETQPRTKEEKDSKKSKLTIPADIRAILDVFSRREWATVEPHGLLLNRANLSEANLSKTYLRMANFIGADLSGADLCGADLREADLSNANLSKANLSEANLEGADLEGADLEGADLSGANLSEADLNQANLSGASLEVADFSRAYLNGANLSGASLFKATLFKAQLHKANLFKAYLHRADLSGADLSEADLREADLFREADFLGTDLREANLSGADLRKAALSGANLFRADISGANLSEANLSGANLVMANLSRADLSQANLSEASLEGADFSRANLNRTDLRKADIEEVNLGGAENLTWEQVSQAIIDDDTKLPPDLEAKRKASKE